MAKLLNPLHSEEAQGTLAKSIIYQFKRGMSFARSYFKPTKKRTALQSTIRNLFKAAMEAWKSLSPDDWAVWNCINKKTKKMGRCEFLSDTLTKTIEDWQLYPIPDRIPKRNITNKVVGYVQTIANLATLTGLSICQIPEVWAVSIGIDGANGRASSGGLFFIVKESDISSDGFYHYALTIAHELTHILLIQHGYTWTLANNQDHETIAEECAIRIAEGNLFPIYTYKGKTLAEIVPNPGC